MKRLDIIKPAIFNACTTALYIAAIASFLFYGQKIAGSQRGDTVFMPMAMLMLLVFSAALVGALLFGRPILWYVDGKKKEAVLLLAYTLGGFFIITIGAVSAMFLVR